jgi:hypothetical protein
MGCARAGAPTLGAQPYRDEARSGLREAQLAPGEAAEALEEFDEALPHGASPTDWELTTIRAFGRAIDRETSAGRKWVISPWPGYFVQTQAAAIPPGLENHFALMDVVVLGKWTDGTLNADLIRRHVRMNGYTLKGQIEHAEIYTLAEQAARQ